MTMKKDLRYLGKLRDAYTYLLSAYKKQNDVPFVRI